jgi:hypothetical protein
VAENFQQRLLAELALFFDPLVRAGADLGRLYDFFVWLGWDLATLLGSNTGPFVNAVGTIATAVADIEQAARTPPEELDELLKALDDVAVAAQAVQDLPAAHGGVQPSHWDELAGDLLALLFVLYLARRAPRAYSLLELLHVVEAEPTAEVVQDGTIVRPAGNRVVLSFGRLGKLLTDPGTELYGIFFPNGLATQSDADTAAAVLFGKLAELLTALGATPLLGAGDDPSPIPATFQDTFGSLLSFVRPFRLGDGDTAAAGATLAIVGRDNGGPGLFVAPFGDLTVSGDVGDWRIEFEVAAGVPGFLVTKSGAAFVQSATAARADVDLKLTRLARDSAAFLVGSATGTRLEIGTFAASATASLALTAPDYGALVEAGESKVVVKSGDGDGFLAKILPPEGLETDFDLAFGWSNTKGVYFRGSAGIEATLPVHKSILGVITVDSVYIAIKLESGEEIHFVLATTGSAALGPIAARVERLGLKATLSFPQNGGNLGPANLDRFGFKLPDGAGLSIDAGPVSGGGYLFIDEEKGLYAGVLQLSFKLIGLTAIGLLNTKMADGSRGFSLLIIITAKFPPIQLGFGFVLTGAGGLLGVNRTIVVDVLRAGVKNHTLDNLLFPENPVRDAPQIISNLSAAFPPAEGHYVFGPMVRLGWGTPTIITLDLGIALELPSPIRLIIMGRLQLALPDEKKATVLLKVDALGIIDFDKGEASVDATLQDSRVVTYPITGDMAMRANWAASPTFALSSGGFNPRFTPPPNFPALERVAIALAQGDNPRLRLEAYFAVTSNTAQVGAHLDAYASADLGILGKFTVQAYLGFDALFQFDPFSLIAEMHAGASLKRNGKALLSVALDITLTGPEPWHAWGQATFELFGKRSIGFDVMIGDAPPPQVPATADPLSELVAAVVKKESWSAQLPPTGAMLVSLRQFTSQEVLAHPLGDVTFHQRVVPLNVDISRVGNAAPANARRFSVGVTIGGSPPKPEPRPVKDYFAAAQFFDLSDDEKLARPSFELMDAGLRFDAGGLSHGAPIATTTFDYETSIVDVERRIVTKLPTRYRLDQEKAFALAGVGAAAIAPSASTGASRYHGPGLAIAYSDQSWSVASRDDLSNLTANGGVSYAEALEQAAAFEAGEPETRTQIVRATEVVA